MKQRFSSLDIRVIAHELSKTLTSLRVSNIYDLSSRIFLFKFAASARKEQFLIDSGFRCHLSSYARTAASTPSNFVSRLRKFLRTRRVTNVAQVGTDRILEFQFSDGQYHLFFEFYAGGNIVLTDADLNVLTLQRIVTEGAEHEHLRVGSQYNLSQRQNVNGIPEMTRDRVKIGLEAFIERQATGQQSTNKKLKKKPGDTLRKALAGFINEYPPMLLDHSLRITGFDINLQPEEVVADEGLLNKLLTAMSEAQRLMDEIMAKDVASGYIFGKPGRPKEVEQEGTSENVMYEDFHPFKPKHLEDDPAIRTLEFEGFNRTVDEFFSSIEGQKLESKLAEKEATAQRKLDNARNEQEKRLGGLQQVQEQNVRKAQAIEANVERVHEATAAVNGLIAQGIDWDEVGKLVELEQKRNNPVAEMIKLPLKLQENTITLRLAEWEVEEDEGFVEGSTDSEPSDSEAEDEAHKSSGSKVKVHDKEQDKRLNVDIDLALSAWSNARDYYDEKRTAAAKKVKTEQASTKAFRNTQRKVEADLKRALKQEKQVLRPVRKQFWFEKFIYFISSDGYLVIGARDAQQSDTLYRKHLKKGDVWCHADLEGAMPFLIKNRQGSEDAPIPPSTLSQAGNVSIATSSAWESKAVMSAWWAKQNQVTKKARTGDYLPPGRFEIKGDKNYLPPAQLLLGFAVLFQISEASKARHLKHRVQDAPPTIDATKASDESDLPPDDEQDNADVADVKSEKADLDEADAAEESVDDELPAEDSKEEKDDNASLDGDAGEEPAYVNPLQTIAQQSNETHAVADGDKMEEAGEEPEPESAESDPNEEQDAETAPDQTGETEAEATASTPEIRSTADKLSAISTKPNMPVRGKRGKKKKIAAKYADQDEADREEAMRLLGSAAGQQKHKEEEVAKVNREAELAAQRQRRREQHQRALERKAQQEEQGADDDDDETEANVDLDTLVGTPLPGDEILEAIPVCAPWGALGRFKYKAKLQPGNEKKGKAVRSILHKWGSDAAQKRNIDERAEDVEKIWPKEMELIKAWREESIFGVLPVGKVRVMMPGANASGKGGGKGKGGKSGGKGSKKK